MTNCEKCGKDMVLNDFGDRDICRKCFVKELANKIMGNLPQLTLSWTDYEDCKTYCENIIKVMEKNKTGDEGVKK